MQVLFTDINEPVGQTTLKEFQKEFGQNNVVFIKADVTSEAQMKGTSTVLVGCSWLQEYSSSFNPITVMMSTENDQ